MNFIITIPGAVPPSGNELRRKYRHWAAYRNLRQSWAKWIAVSATGEICRQLCHLHVKVKVGVHVTRGRQLDQDNLTSGLKPVYDAMKDCLLIVDDSPKWIDAAAPTQHITRNKREWGTRITIEVLP